MVEMTRDEFWAHIEQCRTPPCDMPEFNRRLESMLDAWELPKLAAFHRVMWEDVGVWHDEGEGELRSAMSPTASYLRSDDAWDCYGG